MKAKKIQGYECPHCGDLYEARCDAVECCSSVAYFSGYCCIACGKHFEEKKPAEKCCNPQTTVEGYMYVLRQIERQGQMRLFDS